MCLGIVSALFAGAPIEAQSIWALRTLPLYSPLPDLNSDSPAEPGQVTRVAGLSILIVDGQGAINNIKGRTAREIIIQVEDKNHKRVPGAYVSLNGPSGGPNGTFAGGAHSSTVVTDADGRAVMRSFRPNQVPGKFDIQVTAALNGEIGRAVITETNQL